MYITISPQGLQGNFKASVADFVSYLEKENLGVEGEEVEYFFDQYGRQIDSSEVIRQIDSNTAKLKSNEPKFYSITLNPSQRELKKINSPSGLKSYTMEVMKGYAGAFNREIDGRAIRVEDIKYFAKIEHTRTFKGHDKQVIENQPYATEILKLKQQLRDLPDRTNATEHAKNLQRQILKLESQAPHQLQGKRIVRGMAKPGPQSHVHIIVSRIDQSNRHSLSPGSRYKKSEVTMHGQQVKRGFDRDHFFKASEKAFDRMFGYQRNYVETYKARKEFISNPQKYFKTLMGLPAGERGLALKLLAKAGVEIPIFRVPTGATELTLGAIRQIRRAVGKAIESGSIGI